MSDLHAMPLVGHDLAFDPQVRAQVFRTTPRHWWWSYLSDPDAPSSTALRHGPFESWREAFASARRMVELL